MAFAWCEQVLGWLLSGILEYLIYLCNLLSDTVTTFSRWEDFNWWVV